MRPHGTPESLEKRRRRAIALLKASQTYRAVAAKVGASLSSVVRWYRAYRTQGSKGLRSKPTPGRPPRLSESQKQKVLQLLVKGPLKAGYATDLWTLQRIAKLIAGHCGVRYSIANVWKLMAAWNWSWQKPERRALERDEEAIARWKKSTWPRIKKSPKAGSPSRLSRRKRLSAHPSRA